MSMVLTFAELKKIAKLRYERLSEENKAMVLRFFDDVDANGDGKIRLKELRNSDTMPKLEDDLIRNLFCGLDEDNKGYFDYDDCIALYYLCLHCSRFCRSCRQNIPHGLGFTCYACFTSSSHRPFVVCLDCFAENRFTHHEHPPADILHDFEFHDQLCGNATILRPAPPVLDRTTKPPPVAAQAATVQEFADMKQCVVCGDVHKVTASGFMCNIHMAKMRGTEDQFVCEWCFSYFCSRCGKSFRDSSTRAEPGKWLQKCTCVSCHYSESTTDIYHSTLQRLQELLRKDKLLSDCSTCEIKCAKGTLFWIMNGVNVPQLLPQPRPQTQPQLQPQSPERVSSGGVGYMQPTVNANLIMPMPNPIAPPGQPAKFNNGAGASPQPQPQPAQVQAQAQALAQTQAQHRPSKSNCKIVGNFMDGMRIFGAVVGIVDKPANHGSFNDESVADPGGGAVAGDNSSVMNQ